MRGGRQRGPRRRGWTVATRLDGSNGSRTGRDVCVCTPVRRAHSRPPPPPPTGTRAGRAAGSQRCSPTLLRVPATRPHAVSRATTETPRLTGLFLTQHHPRNGRHAVGCGHGAAVTRRPRRKHRCEHAVSVRQAAPGGRRGPGKPADGCPRQFSEHHRRGPAA